jgi:hypothetical protein
VQILRIGLPLVAIIIVIFIAPLELALDGPADFEPDADYSFSNTNYLLIGRILDKVLGYSHH